MAVAECKPTVSAAHCYSYVELVHPLTYLLGLAYILVSTHSVHLFLMQHSLRAGNTPVKGRPMK